MPFVKIEQDCRVLGHGFSPGEKPVEVEEAVAEALVKEKLGIVVEAAVDGDSGSEGGSSQDDPARDHKGTESN